MKSFFIALMMLIPFILFSVELGSTSKEITAYKTLKTSEVPESEAQLRILNSDNLEVTDSEYIDLPLNARDTEYSAFYWVFSGNIYHSITLKFTFGAMYWEGNSQSSAIIPYTVTLNHTQSRIGNTPIAVNKESNAVSLITNDFSEYFYKYADSVSSLQALVDVNTATASASITYALDSYTKVYDINNFSVNSYPINVCNHWNRYGTGIVHLGITPEGHQVGTTTKFSDGIYYADIAIEIINNN